MGNQMAYYYSTQPFLVWCINRHCYRGVHRLYVGASFYTYRMPNPTSSNPFRIYQDLYEPWRDQDDFNKTVAQTRMNVRKGVHLQMLKGTINADVCRRLKCICDKVDIIFLYPVVYRVDIDLIRPKSRLKKAGSGLSGSKEFLIEDLDESNPHDGFDLLFLDFAGDSDFDRLKLLTAPNWKTAVPILEARCKP
jgi:hypothetical protein